MLLKIILRQKILLVIALKILLVELLNTQRVDLAFAKRQGEKLIALLTISTTQFDADIEGIVVDKNFRNQGHALELLDFAEQNLKQKGIEKIFLEVRMTNESAKNLYIKKGYKQISIRKKYYSDNEDAIVMAKEI